VFGTCSATNNELDAVYLELAGVSSTMAPEWSSTLHVVCGKSMSGSVAVIVTEELGIEQSMSEKNRLT
jgi:hypothetical protein